MIDTSRLGCHEALDARTESFFNDAHRDLVVREIGRLVDVGITPSDIAAICPYAAQASRLARDLDGLVNAGLEIGTVDGFQGREKEVVLVDLVRSNREGHIGFLQDVRRTNVALTRAKRQLFVVAHGETIQHHGYYRALIGAAKKAGAWELCEGLV
jgi:superfamily I DNA and/or RNA helicase